MSKALEITGKALKKRMIRKGKKLLKTNPAPEIPKAQFDKLTKPAAEFFTAGFARADIMPDDIPKKRYYIAGYSAYNPAKGILDAMTTSAIYLDDNSGRGGVVFVSVDSVGLSSYDVNLARENLTEFTRNTGCRSIHV